MITVERYTPSDWGTIAGDAHRAVFAETLPPEFDRIDFALMAVHAGKTPLGYLTARELNAQSVYMKHGGVFPPAAGKTIVLPVYLALLRYLDEYYRLITTLVENTNVPYLKLALTAGFLAVGIRNFQGSILLELLRERGQ